LRIPSIVFLILFFSIKIPGRIWLEMLPDAAQWYTYFARNASFSIDTERKKSKFGFRLQPKRS